MVEPRYCVRWRRFLRTAFAGRRALADPARCRGRSGRSGCARIGSEEEEGLHEVGGPGPVTLREYQNIWREWLRIPGLPRHFGSRTFGWRCWFASGNHRQRPGRRNDVAHAQAREYHHQRLQPRALRNEFGIAPRSLREVLASRPQSGAGPMAGAALLSCTNATLWASLHFGWFPPGWGGRRRRSEIERLAEDSVLARDGAGRDCAVWAATLDLISRILAVDWVLRLRVAIAAMIAHGVGIYAGVRHRIAHALAGSLWADWPRTW